MDSTDQPNSVCHVKPIHMYPLHPTNSKSVPFALLNGETIKHMGSSEDGLIRLSNYRLYLQSGETQYHIPIGLIETVEQKDLFYLHISCKDARTYKCVFGNNEKCLEWYEKILKITEPPKELEQLFAFYHSIWSKEKGPEVSLKLENQNDGFDKIMFENEMGRLQFEGHSWRISKINENFKFCPTYPPFLLVPSCINDDMLEMVAKFRSSRRIPAVVWRHPGNGAVIVRSSQPEVGWLGWRSSEDEDLLKAISDACSFDGNCDKESTLSHSPSSYQSDDSLQLTNKQTPQKKVLIMDARSYTTAVANRARGGGCECPEYYPNCEIQFMNLANIHSIRKSFHALRQLCTSSAEQPNWFSQLEGTRWLLHMSGVMKAAVTLVASIEKDARPVLVHCSDGWDRTPQIVALAELLLDPYYRTIEGFRILVEREWLAFGHKFADRCGNSLGSDDQNERCPVFLQWLDCVHQLLMQFPCAFEFSHSYLVKLVQHTYSNLFGTFLCNTLQERIKLVYKKTFSVWDFLSSPCFRNHLYTSGNGMCDQKVLWPRCNVRDLHLWTDVFLGSNESNCNIECCSELYMKPDESSNHCMTKTRSYGDLLNDDVCINSYRRNSDPNINCESKLGLLSQKQNTALENSLNHCSISNNHKENCFPVELEDGDCNQDCIFKNNDENLEDQINRIDQIDFGDPPPEDNLENNINLQSKVSNNLENIELENEPVSNVNTKNCDDEAHLSVENVIVSEIDKISCDLNNVMCTNKDVRTVSNHKEQLNNSSSELSDSASDLDPFLGLERTVESSTETIVADCVIGQEIPYEREFKDSSTNITASWDNTYNFIQNKTFFSCQYPLGDDGLIILRSAVQERINQIVEEHQRKVESLEKELHIARQNLIKQSCHRCNQTESEQQDDNCSIAESQCSTSEGPASVGESLRSDLSWVAVDDVSMDCQRTLWVPDHAVNKCTGCNTEFWLGRRRHHCRKCGRIFCADCSENSTPLPSEHLYNPVRVCTNCFTEVQQDCGDMPKHTNTQSVNTSPRIAASSN